MCKMFPFNEFFEKPHSNLKDIESILRECDCIKYAAYRTAAKLRVIQKSLHMDKVSLRVISGIFERHQLQQTENSVQLDLKELHSVLLDLYFIAQRESQTELNLDSVTQLMIDFLLNVYDKNLKNIIQVLSLKVGLTLLCQAKPREKYHYLFEQLADHNNCLSRKKLQILLKKMISITEYVCEGLSFGSELIPGTVESCFQCNIGTLGISEDAFINWIMQDPQLLVWFSTLYRMQISELVPHNAKCAMCKFYPIVGLRYRCLRCLSCDMCQSCFFTGKLNKKHKLKHPVQEYCCPMTSQQSTKAFLLTIRNRLYKKNSKLQYLPALRVDSNEIQALGQSTRLLDEMEVSSKTLINGSRVSLRKFPYRELHSIILHLERESEKLIPKIENFFLNIENSEIGDHQLELKNCLLKHKTQVETQVQRIKLLKNYLMSSGKFEARAFLASTPVVEGFLLKNQKRGLNNDLENFSPITRHAPKTIKGEISGKKMIWDNYDFVNGGVDASWEEIKSEQPDINIFELSSQPKVCGVSEPPNKTVESGGMSLSVWLGGEDLKEFDTSSKRGLTWLREMDDGGKPNGEVKEESEETFEELQDDLKQILNKLHELSIATSKGEIDDKDNDADKREAKMEAAVEVDTLLVDLISGIEKLVGS